MFEKIKCFILDMDGTIYLGNELFPFTKDFLKKVEETGREYYFFTNNSSKSQQAYIEKLDKLGIPIQKEQIIICSFWIGIPSLSNFSIYACWLFEELFVKK